MRYALATVSVILLASFDHEVDSYRVFDVQNDVDLYEAAEDQKPEQVLIVSEEKNLVIEAIEKKFNEIADVSKKLLKEVSEKKDASDQIDKVMKQMKELEEFNNKKIAQLEEKNIKLEKEVKNALNKLEAKNLETKQQKIAVVNLEPKQQKVAAVKLEPVASSLVSAPETEQKAMTIWEWICMAARVVVGKVIRWLHLG